MSHLLISVLAALVVGLPGGDKPMVPLLGKASLSDVLLQFGPADGAYLAGADTEGGPSAADPVVLSFKKGFTLEREHPARMLAFFDPLSLVLKSVRIELASPASVDELVFRFGRDHRAISQELEVLDGELEATLRPCHTPGAPYRSLLFQDAGLVAELNAAGDVTALRFSFAVLSGAERYSPCPGNRPRD